MNNTLPTLTNNYIAIDNENKNIIINLDHPGETWGLVLNAPETDVKMKFNSLEIETLNDISLKTPEDKYILLNTTREQYVAWLENNEKLLKEMESKSPVCMIEANNAISS